MRKVSKNKKCDFCDFVGKVIETWGKSYCKPCWEKKPKKGKGHSGMIGMKVLTLQDTLPFHKHIYLERTTKGNKEFATIYLNHYPGSKGIVGRQLNYFIKESGRILGIIGGNSPPLNYKKFNKYFNDNYTELNWLNNNVYKLLIQRKNLGTKVLKLFRNTIKRDYQEKFKDQLIGLITFVEPPRTGAMYKADNWDYLGETEGKRCFRRGDHGKWINKEWGTGSKKLIFAKQLQPYNPPKIKS